MKEVAGERKPTFISRAMSTYEGIDVAVKLFGRHDCAGRERIWRFINLYQGLDPAVKEYLSAHSVTVEFYSIKKWWNA